MISDIGIWVAYMAIPVILIYFGRRHSAPYSSIFGWFGAFIMLCGLTHLVDALSPVWPAYRFAGVLKAVTAAVSLVTVAKLVPVIPYALSMRDPLELEAAVRTSEKLLARQEALIRVVAEVAWLTDPEGNVRPEYDGWLRVTGQDREQWERGDWTQALHPEDRERAGAAWRHAVETGGNYLCEYRIMTPSGSYRHSQARGVPVRDEAGTIVEWVGINIDVHKERVLREDLEAMAYVTSHDLKAPLRNIASLATWIEDDHGAQMPEGALARLRQMRQRVKRMDDLINGVLEYSRIGRMDTTVAEVGLADVVAEVCDSLGAAGRVEVQAGLPAVMSNRTRITQIFQNLLSNALAHHPRPAEARIAVGWENRGDFHVFWVSDDGDGIDPKHQGKLFRLFTKLSSNPDSTGVGLALVKKIVEGKGGRVWVESEVGRGATFYFTLPSDRIRPSAP